MSINQVIYSNVYRFPYPNIFLGTLAYKAAAAIQRPVETVLEDMQSLYARAENKRKWVDSLVSYATYPIKILKI